MPDIDIKRIEKSDADPKVKEVYKLLKKYQRQPERTEWIKKRADCWDAVYEYDEKSTIWTAEERKAMDEKGMIPLTINDLYKGVQGSAAVVTDQKPGIEFLPVGSGDLYVAELMKRAHDQVWAGNDGGTEAYEFVREAKIGGMGVMDARHDPAKGIYGKCIFGHFDPETLYFDIQKSQKPDLSDTPIIKAHLITKAYAKETYEDVKDADLTFEAAAQADQGVAKTDTATGVDNYTRDEQDSPPAGPDDIPEDVEDVWEIEAHMLKRERELWLMIPDGQGGFTRKTFTKDQKSDAEEAQEATPDSVLWKRVVEKRTLRIIVGKKLIKQIEDGAEVDELTNPYGVDVDGDPIMPVVVLFHDRTRKGKPVSPTVFAKEACKERNKRRAQAIYMVSKNIDAPLITAGTIKWHKDPLHGDWGEVDKSSPWQPRVMTPGSVSNEAMNMEAVAKNDIDDMYDMHDVMKGKIPPGDPSGRTILALQDMAGMMSKPFTRSLEAALVRLGKVNIAIILKTWPRKMWERLIEADEMQTWQPEEEKKPRNPMDAMNGPPQEMSDPEKQKITQKWQAALELVRPMDVEKPSGISLIDVDVRVAAGSTMPTNRMARAALAMDMVDKGIYDPQAALEYLDDPKKDQIVARLDAKNQAMMQAEMAKQGNIPPGGM
jgi:hypothetical protein